MGVTPLGTGTNVSETIGQKEYGRSLLFDATGADAMGLVDANPAPLSFFGRLKAIYDAVLRTGPATRIFAIVPSDTQMVIPAPRALRVTVPGNLAVRGTDTSPVTIPVIANELIPFSPAYVLQTGTTATVVGLA